MSKRLYGKPKPMAQQASLVLRSFLTLSSRHQAKAEQALRGSRSTGKIHSLRTFEKYSHCLKQAGLWAQQHHGLQYLKEFTPPLAQAYLEARRDQVGQKQLDAERNALEFITGKQTLVRAQPREDKARYAQQSRAYSPAQIQRIAQHQTAPNALATQIAYCAGLRAHELLALRPLSEGQASAHRSWRAERFQGRDGVRYLVTGKGGLRREVLIPEKLARQLEAQRRDTPAAITDRGIHHQSWYAINGGETWARSFSAAARRCLGWSSGAHGVRHSYAQERLAELQAQGLDYQNAREIVSQELGHFRGDVVETYLR